MNNTTLRLLKYNNNKLLFSKNMVDALAKDYTSYQVLFFFLNS